MKAKRMMAVLAVGLLMLTGMPCVVSAAAPPTQFIFIATDGDQPIQGLKITIQLKSRQQELPAFSITTGSDGQAKTTLSCDFFGKISGARYEYSATHNGTTKSGGITDCMGPLVNLSW